MDIKAGEQPVTIVSVEETIDVSLVKETINVPVTDGQTQFSIKEERFEFSSSLVLGAEATGWPFGANPTKVEGLTKDTPVVVDAVAMPSHYRVVKWLILLSDDINDLEVTSEIKCIRRRNIVQFVEYAIMGDSTTIQYDLDVVVDNENVQLIITSRYDGVLTARTLKIGIYN